jgi:glutamine amidotransferase
VCLAIYKPPRVIVPRDALANGFDSNAHGAGFAYVQNDTLVTVKGLFTFDAFWSAYNPHRYKQAIIHFRWATSGLHDEGNCHPFAISDDTAMIHNGVLDIPCDVDRERSDTWHYCHHILRPLAERDPSFFTQPAMIYMGASAIGSDKFCFLRANGDWSIWNEDRGEWDGDSWYSNPSYLYSRQWYTNTTATASDSRFIVDEPDTKWWHDIEAVDDAKVVESTYYEYLEAEYRRAYSDMLEDGYSIAELDQMIEYEGEESLLEYVNFNGGVTDVK